MLTGVAQTLGVCHGQDTISTDHAVTLDYLYATPLLKPSTLPPRPPLGNDKLPGVHRTMMKRKTDCF